MTAENDPGSARRDPPSTERPRVAPGQGGADRVAPGQSQRLPPPRRTPPVQKPPSPPTVHA